MSSYQEKTDAFLDKFSAARGGNASGYLIAAGMVVAALFARLSIAPAESAMPFLTFFPAVTLAAVLCGTGPGLFAMLLCVMLASYLFIPPFVALPLTFDAELIRTNVVFCIEEAIVILVVEGMYRQRSRLVCTTDLFGQIKEANVEVLSLEREFHLLAENLPDIVSRFDREFRCTYVNLEFEKVTGMSREFVLGKTHAELGIADSVVKAWTEVLHRVFTDGQLASFEFVFPNQDGVLRQYQVRAVPEFAASGAVETILTIARDISTLKETEAVMRENEKRFHGMTSNVPGMVFQCIRRSGEDRLLFTYVSDGAEWLLGMTASAIQSDENAFIGCFAQEHVSSFHESIAHSQLALTLWNWEGCATAPDGSVKWINLRATPRRLSADVCLWDGVAINITRSKTSEAQLLYSQKMLRELSAHLESVREEERKHIAREIHDELGQTLTALRMNVSLMRMGFGVSNPELMERLNAMTQLVGRTVDIARHITTCLRPGALDLGIAAALEWQVEEFIGYTNIPCELALGDGDISLDESSATSVFRIIQESLTNVARHAGASQVEIIVNRSADHLCFEVSDNGKGFDPDLVAKRKSFGLIGIRERVAMLGGNFDLCSNPGQGTRLRVWIPVA